MKRILIILTLLVGLYSKPLFAMDSHNLIGVVNFASCATDSKYGKNEQEQFENIRKQWTTLIEETENELKDISAKFDDQEYLDGLSPEAEEELRIKQKTLNEDIAKYQNQLYQILNQAQYFFMQKMSTTIARASESVAKDKKIDMVMNKEACFYYNPNLDITDLVIKEMDKNFEKEEAKNAASLPNAVEETKEAASAEEISNEMIETVEAKS